MRILFSLAYLAKSSFISISFVFFMFFMSKRDGCISGLFRSNCLNNYYFALVLCL
jgi:hypothetical protein